MESNLCISIIKHGTDHMFPIFDQRLWVRQARNIQLSSAVPGGYDVCTFEVQVRDARWEWLFLKRTYEVLVTDGLRCVWSGRLEDITPVVGSGGDVIKVKAMGWAKNVRDRLVDSLSYGGATTGKTIIQDALLYCPRIDTNYSEIQDPNVDLQTKSWDMTPAAEIIQEVLDSGDDQTPPRTWYWAAWCANFVTGDVGEENVNVAASLDDAADEPTTPTFYGVQDRIIAGTLSGNVWVGGMRFLTIDIPQGAIIDSAVLKVYAYDTGLNAGDFSIWADDVDDSAAFSAPDAPSDRTLTTASVAWAPAAWVAGTQYTSPEIKTVIQEIIDRPTWTRNNDLSIIVTKAGNYGRFRSWDYAPSGTYAPRLEIDWHLPAVRRAKMVVWPKDLTTWEYEVWARETEGGVELVRGTDGLANAARVQYDAGAGDVWTAWDTDTDSIADNDRRDYSESIGAAAQAVAENVRDMQLDARKDVRRVAGSITVKNFIRTRFGGLPVPVSWVRAGERVLIKDVDYGAGIVYLIKSASYSDDDRTVTIVPDEDTNTIRAWLAQQMTE